MSGKNAGYSSGVRELISTEMGQKDPLLGQNAGGSNLNVGSRAKATKNNESENLSRLDGCSSETSAPYGRVPHGGHVVSRKNERREEMIFMSSKAVRRSSKAIGIVIHINFPHFTNSSSLEQHGFASTRLWSLDSSPSPLPPVSN